MENEIGIVSSNIGSSGGGVYYAVKELIKSLGVGRVTLYGVRPSSSFESSFFSRLSCKIYLYKPFLISKLAFSIKFVFLILRSNCNVFHIHGIWSLQPFVCFLFNSRIPRIISPHGMLAPWVAKSGVLKKIFYFLFLDKSLSASAVIHALTDVELSQIRSMGLKNEVAVIPNPIEPAFSGVHEKGDVLEIIYIGRYTNGKGLLELIDAVSITKGIPLSLNLFGWGEEKYINTLREKVSKLGLTDIVSINGPIFGRDKIDALSKSDLFVLPSAAEGLPMAVLEAWACSTPTIISKHCNLDIGGDKGASFILEDCSVSTISESIKTFSKLSSSEFICMQRSAYQLISTNYSHSVVSKMMNELYEYVSGNGDRPCFVTLE